LLHIQPHYAQMLINPK